MNYEVIEHSAFSKRWARRADDDDLDQLRKRLVANPEAGDPIPGCGMLRKLRVADPSRGKGTRGGLRVIYLHSKEAKRIRLLTVYGKDEKEDLAFDELKAWCAAAKQLRQADQNWARTQVGEKEKRK